MAYETKTAIITGTTGGLGRSLKQQFEATGWKVVSLDRSIVDLASPDLLAVCRLFALLGHPPRVVFVNNAASLHIGAASDDAPVERELTINVTSPIRLISAFLRAFPHGEVANITSSVVGEPIPNLSLYTAGKAAMEGYVRSLEAEGVRCYSLNPGAIDTDMAAKLRASPLTAGQHVKLRCPQIVAKAFVWQIDRSG